MIHPNATPVDGGIGSRASGQSTVIDMEKPGEFVTGLIIYSQYALRARSPQVNRINYLHTDHFISTIFCIWGVARLVTSSRVSRTDACTK